jgi:DNA primase
MVDATVVKARNDLQVVLEADLGPPDKKGMWLCPFHQEDTPSFHVTPDGRRWKCFGCGETGDVIAYVMRRDNVGFVEACARLGGDGGSPNGEARDKFLAEFVERRERARQRQEERRKQVYERIAGMWDVAISYCAALTPALQEWWYAKGVNDQSIGQFWLGYCVRCPTDEAGRPSYTIPITYKERLLNIRHRLVGAASEASGDKYRPQIAGLGAAMFNADILLQPAEYVLLVEGEIKAIVLTQLGYRAVGIPGASSFKEAWGRCFWNQRTVYIALDPGAETQGERIADLLGNKARIVRSPCKPDDFFVQYGGTKQDFDALLRLSRDGHG